MTHSEIITKFAGQLYDTYCVAVGGKAFDGAPLPSWEEFSKDPSKEKQVNAWCLVAERSLPYRNDELCRYRVITCAATGTVRLVPGKLDTEIATFATGMNHEAEAIHAILQGSASLIAYARQLGRQEAARTLLERNPEDFCDEFMGSHAIGDTGDYSTHWKEDKVRKLLGAEDVNNLVEHLDNLTFEQHVENYELQHQLEALRNPGGDLPTVGARATIHHVGCPRCDHEFEAEIHANES